MPSKKVLAAGTKRTRVDETGKAEDKSAAIEARLKKVLKTAASQRKVWENESDTENPDTDMLDCPESHTFWWEVTCT